MLYDALGLERARIRLVGVRVEGLAPTASTPRQLSLDATGDDWRAAEQAVDRAAAKFGPGAVRPAALVDDPGPPSADSTRR